MILRLTFLALLFISCWTKLLLAAGHSAGVDFWTDTELALISSLSLDRLGPPPTDPSNRYADNQKAAELGRAIFHDMRFSLNGDVSCATCHKPDYHFTDPLPRSRGLGLTKRHSMPIVGMAYQNWFFWDGRKDSLWAQVLEPLEHPMEHGISRTRIAQLVDMYYLEQYIEIFGEISDLDFSTLPVDARPDLADKDAWSHWQSLSETKQKSITRIFVNIGKSIAAFVRLIVPTPSSFDRYVEAINTGDNAGVETLTTQQVSGLRLFIGKAKCINCHNGPMLTNGEFHHAGAPDTETIDFGRSVAMNTLRENEFGYLSKWSDANPDKDGHHIRFLDTSSARYERSFKTPSLRNVSVRPPYMHTGQVNSLSDVLEAYRDNSGEGLADELFHSELTREELGDLEAFLQSLTSEPMVKQKSKSNPQ